MLGSSSCLFLRACASFFSDTFEEFFFLFFSLFRICLYLFWSYGKMYLYLIFAFFWEIFSDVIEICAVLLVELIEKGLLFEGPELRFFWTIHTSLTWKWNWKWLIILTPRFHRLCIFFLFVWLELEWYWINNWLKSLFLVIISMRIDGRLLVLQQQRRWTLLLRFW